MTLVSERDQPKFGAIERFLEKPVRKEPLPDSLCKAPQYNPDRRASRPTNRRPSSRKPQKRRKPNKPKTTKTN